MIRLTKQQAWTARDIYNQQTDGGKIKAIKYVKHQTGCSLKDAKETVEDLMANRFRPQNHMRRTIDDDWEVSSERQYVADAMETAMEAIDELLEGIKEAARGEKTPDVDAYETMARQAKDFIKQSMTEYTGEP
jgi:hypothetical protein